MTNTPTKGMTNTPFKGRDYVYVDNAPPLKPSKLRLTTSSVRPLLYEYGKDTAYLTLKDNDIFYDGKYYYSLRKLFVETRDPSETIFAMKYFLNWEHWLNFSKSPIISDTVTKAREELVSLLRSESFAKLLEIANDPSHKFYYNALRYIESGDWSKANPEIALSSVFSKPKAAKMNKELQLSREKEEKRKLDFKEDYNRMMKLYS